MITRITGNLSSLALAFVMVSAFVGTFFLNTAQAYDVLYQKTPYDHTISTFTGNYGFLDSTDSIFATSSVFVVHAVQVDYLKQVSSTGNTYVTLRETSDDPGDSSVNDIGGDCDSDSQEVTTAGSYLFVFSHPCTITTHSFNTSTQFPYVLVQVNGFGGQEEMGLAHNTQPSGSGGTIEAQGFAGILYGASYPTAGSSGGSTNTRLDSVIPSPDSSVATSTSFTFGATGYVNPADWTSDTVLHIRAMQLTGELLRGNGGVLQRFETKIPITASTTFSLTATSTVTNSGQWLVYIAIEKPSYSVFGVTVPFFTTTLAKEYYKFEAATSSAAEQEQAVLLLETSSLAASTTATSQLQCAFLSTSFSIGDCITLLVKPTDDQLSQDLEDIRSGFLTRMPWGYPTRLIAILSNSSSTAALPTYTATFSVGPGSGGTSTESLSFDPGDMIAGGAVLLNSVKDPNTGQSLEDIAKPIVDLFIAISLLLIIVRDVLAMEHGHHGGGKNKLS